MRRYRANKHKDRRIFSRTADMTHRKNLQTGVHRGGNRM